MLASRVLMSKLIYLMPVWAGCEEYLVNALQIIQNKVARVVTKLDWSTSTAVLLNQVGWLSVNQLIFYHSVLQIYKVNKAQTPKYLDSMFSWTYIYNTRQAVGGVIRLVGKPRLDVTKNSFRWRAANQYNQLPAEIRRCQTLASFKTNAKTCIKENVSLS